MSILSMALPMLVPLVIRGAKSAIDSYVKGEELSEDQVKGIQSGYVMGKIWLRDVVADTDNTYDDAGLQAFFESCEDAAGEGEFLLPTVD